MSAPCDLHIATDSLQNFPEKYILQAVQLGYRTFAVDQSVINEPDTKQKVKYSIKKVTCPESFQSKLQKVNDGDKIKILSRITVECTGKSNISRTMKPQLEQFDLIAGKPLDGLALERLVEEDVDIITLDADYRKSYYFKKELVKMAIRRGIVFELNYGPCVADSTARQHTIELAQELLIFSKGKNVILSSGHNSVQFNRGPYDVANLAVLFGLPIGMAKLTVSKNCLDALKHSELRKSIAGSMDIHKVVADGVTNCEPSEKQKKRKSHQTPNPKNKKLKADQ
ncbi:ribonuclease P protein subunit p30-like [Watersipora subatra]|uniref:ribonuclease P protein subunit p30-like n=1 Tax=Watersipora subatra TaxID=2589382 RepID=UPI00355BE23C